MARDANRVSASRLQHLSQILKVPVAFFFEGAPGGADAAPATPSYVNEFCASSDGLALAKAFMRIARTERENLTGDAKGKGASGANREAESTDAPGRGGLLRSSDETG
jgi:hypothetical protein